MSDEQALIDNAIAGDIDAFGQLLALYQQPLINLAYRMLGNLQEAEDATQEAFIRAFKNISTYDASRSFKTWIFSITSNHCIDRLRKRRLTYVSIDDPLPPHPALVGNEKNDPEKSLLNQERSVYIQQLLDTLNPEYRAAVILRYWYELSYAEIAEALDTTESAIKSRLFRARQTLADSLEHQETQSKQ